MQGRAHKLLQDFKARNSGLAGNFMMCRLILLSKVVPETITPEFDDPVVEARLEQAIAQLEQQRAEAAQARAPRG